MKPSRHFSNYAMFVVALLPCALSWAATEITQLKELRSLAPETTTTGRPLRVQGVVVCYDAGWHQLYLHDGEESGYFNADDFVRKPKVGQRVEISGTAFGGESFANLELNVLGEGEIPQAKRMDLSQLSSEHGEWIETRGEVLSVEASRGRLALLIHDKRQNCLVYVLGGPPPEDFRRWMRCQVRVRGINASKVNGARLEPAMIFAPGPGEVEILEKPPVTSPEIPVISIGSLLNRELDPWTNQWVHVNALVSSYEPGRMLLLKDPTGTIRARIVQMTDMRGEERVEAWGFLEVGPDQVFLNCAYFEVIRPSTTGGEKADTLSMASSSTPSTVLTEIPEILKLSRKEAARPRSVRIRGTITFADQDWRNAFIEDRSAAVYVYLGPTDVAPQSGDVVELTGVTGPGGFAPEVLSSRIRVLGTTNLSPSPRVDLDDLANGHLDAHWIEMEGVVRRADKQSGHLVLSLMTPKGRFKAMIPGFETKPMPSELIGARVSVQGACSSELNTRHQLSGITLHAPSLTHIRVIEPAPEDPFAMDLTPIAAVGTFDPNRPLDRSVKVAGVITLKVGDSGFVVQDESGGIKVLSQKANTVRTGDRVEVLGFPAIGDFSPYLEEGVVRSLGRGPMPEVKQTTADQILLQGTNDGQRVEIRARLLQNVAHSANPQLVLQDGPIIFTAHLETQKERWELPALRSGSLLKLVGVCLIQGGERHEPETFRLLIGESNGIKLLEAPPWWTSRRAFTAAGAMGLAIIAALAWVGLLRRQVRAQTKMILEISTREQRRIGHDLHDGVCQQLAGIAFMTSTLADELETQGIAQSAQADRISRMINEVTDHTRSVARGLFPIWLEENGLLSALEELTTNASEIFKLNCRFVPGESTTQVENAIALHLYYIALEAITNAAKHGQAQNVTVRFEAGDNWYLLSVQDDGAGFLLSESGASGMGLRIMNYRARVIGASLVVKSKPGQGTRVVCNFPPEGLKRPRLSKREVRYEDVVQADEL